MNKKPAEVKQKSMALFKGKKFKCKRTGRYYILADVLLSHKPIVMPGGQIGGDIRGVILQTVITPPQLVDFEEVQEPKPKMVVEA